MGRPKTLKSVLGQSPLRQTPSLPRLRALQVCRRRPTLGVVAVPHGRHPETFTRAGERSPGWHHKITPALSPAADQGRWFLRQWRSVPRRQVDVEPTVGTARHAIFAVARWYG